MREYQSFGALARHLEQLAAIGGEVTAHIADQAGAEMAGIAKDKVGHYQPAVAGSSVAGWPAWEPLAASTEAEKRRLGAPLGAPLLRHGEFYASISHQVKVSGLEAVAVAGSPMEKATWFETGTSRMPPRPVFGPAGFESRRPVEEGATAIVVAWITGRMWAGSFQVIRLP